MNRLKILISAHELSPGQGSECAVGWNLVTRIARYHDVTVLHALGSQFVPEAYKQAIDAWISANGNPNNIRFIAVPQPRATLLLAKLNRQVTRNISSIGLPVIYFMGYRLWQKEAYRTAEKLVKENSFQIVHQLTSVTFKEPGYMWKLPVPFVWGPTGGNSALPVRFFPHLGFRTGLYEFLRIIATRFSIEFGTRINKAIRKSSMIYAFSANDERKFRSRGAEEVRVMLDTGCDIDEGFGFGVPGFVFRVSSSDFKDKGSKLKVLWCGQLIKRKALEILLKAVAGDPFLRENVEITIIGDGPLRKHYEKLAHSLFFLPDTRYPIPDTRPKVTFTGLLPREQVFNYMKTSDVLVHTSYREAASTVIPEALSFGLPVICHDISGMSIAITDECGIKVPLKSYDESIIGFRSALKPVVQNSKLVIGLRNGALHRATELSWDSMAEQIASDYNKIVEAK
jgi:glycosyltransferase involved in cell wall biosynthesis